MAGPDVDDEKEHMMNARDHHATPEHEHDAVTPQEVEAQGGAALPDKEAMSPLISVGDIGLSIGDIMLDVDAPINANVGVYAPITVPIDADLGIYAPINADVDI